MTDVADELAHFSTRRDLLIQRQSFGSRVFWNVKDPISLRFSQLRDEEYFLFKRLDRCRDVAGLIHDFNRQFSPVQLTVAELKRYARLLQSQGLLHDSREPGHRLLRRRDLLASRLRRATLRNPLAIRWRGVHPKRIISWLEPWTRWCFSSLAMFSAAMLIVSAITVLLVHWDEASRRLPTLQAFITPQNLLWLIVVTAAAKVLHELAHAMTCKRFGGECRELGVMLLVFTPCLYCDVSDAWLMKNKWHRIAISAAGIIVEMVLASVAALLWWWSEPSLLNTLAFNTMTVCSVGTIFFNGNPLLKYDGYYVLADLVEVPNLRTRASAMLGDWLARVCFGVAGGNDRELPDRGRFWLLVYAITASIYRVILLGSILWVLHQMLRPFGLEIIVRLLTITMVFGLLMGMLTMFRNFFRRVSLNQMKPLRLLSTLLILAGLLVTVFAVPLPQSVRAPIVIQTDGGVPVYVAAKGRISANAETVAKVGQSVRQGELLMQLESAELEFEIAELEASVKEIQTRNEALVSRRLVSEALAGGLPTTQQLLQSLEQRLSQKLVQRESLRIVAPCDGVVLPSERVDSSEKEQRLQQWSGTPLDEENRGCTLSPGTLLCWIGNPARVAAVAVVDQSDVPLLSLNQSARVRTRGCTGDSLRGHVTQVSLAEFDAAPRTFSEASDLPMIQDASGNKRDAGVSFNVRIPLEPDERVIPIRGTGWAKIDVEPVTLAKRIQRYIAGTFRWSL